MFKRRRLKQQTSLQDRLATWANQIRQAAVALPPGPERESMVKRARQAEVAAHLDEWVKSPGLQSPR